MGQVFYDMGFLSSVEVVECSTSDIIGQYVGHTGPLVKKTLEKALGRVLFIDEAYRLGEGHFAKEAVDELVSCLTLERYKGRVIVILAGYDQEINQLLAVNPGLSSRFTEEVYFSPMTPLQSIELLKIELGKKKITCDALTSVNSPSHQRIIDLLEELTSFPSWGNARDVKELGKKMIHQLFLSLTTASGPSNSQNTSILSDEVAISCIETMLSQKRSREASAPKHPFSGPFSLPQQVLPPPSGPPPPHIKTMQQTSQKDLDAAPQPESSDSTTSSADQRDAGVSDDVWRRLQMDKLAELQAARKAEEEKKKLEQELREAEEKEKEAKRLRDAAIAAEKAAKDETERRELMRQREERRLAEIKAQEERARIAKMLEEKRKEEERQRKEEAKVQAKIREMGLCVAGFRWIKQASGYRCAGGSHFLSNDQLGI
jgi:hypothetical protein